MPVITMSFPLGISTEMSFRLCSLAPIILIVSKVALFYLLFESAMNGFIPEAHTTSVEELATSGDALQTA